MLLSIYLVLVAIGCACTYFAVTPPVERAEIVQPVAAVVASVVFALVALSSLNIVVPLDGGETFVERSFYLVVWWGGMALLNVVALVVGPFERGTEELSRAGPGGRTQ